jgi:cytochrome c biogenesis protein CcdA
VSQPVLAVAGTASGPLLYAFTLGLVASVNPCGFPLLPAYLSFFVGDHDAVAGDPEGMGGNGAPRRYGRGLGAGAGVTAGFVLVFGLLGILVEAGIDVVLGWVPWVMIPVGLAMALIGAAAALGRPLRVVGPRRRLGSGRGVLSMIGFGVTYAVASLTCALPLFLAAVVGSFGRLGFFDGLGTFVAYALGMGLFLMVAGLVVAHAGAAPLRRLRPISRVVPRLAGGVLGLVGAYLAFYWASFVVDPSSTPEPIGAVEHVQGIVTSWLSGSPRVIGSVLGAILLGAIAVGGLSVRVTRRPAKTSGVGSKASAPESARAGG